jgi:RHS repeat-associated protein
MRKTILTLSIIFATCVGVTHAQAIFRKYGFKKAPLTLSKGKYNEFFTNDEVVQIGTVKFNTRTNKVIQLLEEDTTKNNYLSDRSSIWYSVDPLAEKYPNYSPYVYCNNNPIKYIDPDGRGPELVLAGAAAVLEYSLLATGVITTGAILYKNADGIIQIKDDVKAKLGVIAIVAISTQLAQYENFKSSLDAFSDKSKNKESKTNENSQATASTAMPNMPQNDHDKKTEKTKNSSEQKNSSEKNKDNTPDGFKQTKKYGYQHGQKVYEYDGKYYSKDVDSHNGGSWKVFEEKNGRLNRVGTADENLKIIKK